VAVLAPERGHDRLLALPPGALAAVATVQNGGIRCRLLRGQVPSTTP
jgi:hypothetical protein